MPQDATFVGAKELFTKKSVLIKFALAHVIYKNSRCISLNNLMYIQYKYFKYSLCSIGIQFEVYKFTLYMDSELVVLY
jgi:hypothetical protein